MLEVKKVEFGAKINKAQIDRINFIQFISFNAFNEDTLLENKVFKVQKSRYNFRRKYNVRNELKQHPELIMPI